MAVALGATDGLFLPYRGPSGTYLPGRDQARDPLGTISEAQGVYRRRGAPWMPSLVAPRTEGGRKQAERMLSEAIDAKLVTAEGRAGRREHVKLTPRGETLARFWCLTASVSESAAIFRRLVQLLRDGRAATYLGRQYVDQIDLAETTYDDPENGRRVARLEFDALPLLSRGLVTASHAMDGRIWWSTRDAVATPPEDANVELPAWDGATGEAMATLYDQARKAVEASLVAAAAEERLRTIVIPLSASMHAGESSDPPAAIVHHLRYGRGPLPGSTARARSQTPRGNA